MFSGFCVAQTRQTLEDIKMLYIDWYKHQDSNVTLMFSDFCVAETRQTVYDEISKHEKKSITLLTFLSMDVI